MILVLSIMGYCWWKKALLSWRIRIDTIFSLACSIAAVIIISAVLVMLSKNVEPKKTVKKSKKVKTKKGW